MKSNSLKLHLLSERNLFILFGLVMTLVLRSSTAYCFELKKYREQLKKATELENEAKKRSSELLKLLNTTENNLELKTREGKIIAYPKYYVRPHYRFSSSFFKDVLTKAAKTVKMDELFNVPPRLDPSKFISEVHLEMMRRQDDVFRKVVGDFNPLVDQVWILARQDTPALGKDDELEEVTKYKHALRDAISEQIAVADVDSKVKIKDVLGDLQDIDIFDRYVTRLIFSKVLPKKAEQKNDRILETPVSLSMLISLRTNTDPYFIRVLSFFRGHIEKMAQEYYVRRKTVNNQNEDDQSREEVVAYATDDYISLAQDKFQRDESGNFRIKSDLNAEQKSRFRRLEDVASYLDGKLRTAKEINQRMSGLDTEQLEALIALLIQLRKIDIPSKGEAAQMVSILGPAPENNKPHPQSFYDYDFYHQMDEELDQLEEYLPAERARLEAEDKIRKEIIQGGVKQ